MRVSAQTEDPERKNNPDGRRIDTSPARSCTDRGQGQQNWGNENPVAKKTSSKGRMKTKNKPQREGSKKTSRSGDIKKSAKRIAHNRCQN
jgi:hypothetical protein